MDYDELRPTISICFVNTPVFPEVPAHHLVFQLRERHHGVDFTDQLQVHILELAKFTLGGEQLTEPADPWLYFLCHGEELDTEALPPALEFPEIRKALGELQMMTQSELERDRYEARLKMQRDISSAMAEARREGQRQGRVEGRAEAHAEGRVEGRIQELPRFIHLCQRVLKLDQTPEEQLRALPLEALERLAQQLEKEMTEKFGGDR
jgi:predicted transposase/invertase (TIGR01784 family)